MPSAGSSRVTLTRGTTPSISQPHIPSYVQDVYVKVGAMYSRVILYSRVCTVSYPRGTGRYELPAVTSHWRANHIPGTATGRLPKQFCATVLYCTSSIYRHCGCRYFSASKKKTKNIWKSSLVEVYAHSLCEFINMFATRLYLLTQEPNSGNYFPRVKLPRE